jgi:hypothetical protein
LEKKRSLLWFLLFLFSVSSLGCLPGKKMTVGSAAILLEGVAKSSYRQSDLRLIREGMPAYLMLLDGMVETLPDNAELLLAAAQGYSSFASAFIEDRNQEYAALLSEKAKRYALKALEIKGVKNPEESPLDLFQKEISGFGKKEIPHLFWAAACWANWISKNLDSMEAMAQLPKVEVMMQRVLKIDEGFYFGGAHLFMGIWYASRPPMYGGDLKKSQNHFQKAFDFGKGKFLMAYIYYADVYARKAQEKELFISTLQTVLKTPADILPEITLLNTVAKKKAAELLEHAEEYFD